MRQQFMDAGTRKALEGILAEHQGVEGALLPIFHSVQKAFGYIPTDALSMIAQNQNISYAEAYGVLSFYHDFRQEPVGRKVLKICRAEACQSMGAEELGRQAREKLGLEWGKTSEDRAVTLEQAFCLGLCACAPAAMVGDKPVGRLDAEKLDALIEELRT